MIVAETTAKAIVPVTSQERELLAFVATSKEISGFRFLLLAWIVGSYLLLCSGVAYVVSEAKENQLRSEAEKFDDCIVEKMRDIKICNEPVISSPSPCLNYDVAQHHQPAAYPVELDGLAMVLQLRAHDHQCFAQG